MLILMRFISTLRALRNNACVAIFSKTLAWVLFGNWFKLDASLLNIFIFIIYVTGQFPYFFIFLILLFLKRDLLFLGFFY